MRITGMITARAAARVGSRGLARFARGCGISAAPSTVPTARYYGHQSPSHSPEARMWKEIQESMGGTDRSKRKSIQRWTIAWCALTGAMISQTTMMWLRRRRVDKLNQQVPPITWEEFRTKYLERGLVSWPRLLSLNRHPSNA